MKKRKYSAAFQARHASFTPLCFSVDGLLGNEACFFLRRLLELLAAKWGESYGENLKNGSNFMST